MHMTGIVSSIGVSDNKSKIEQKRDLHSSLDYYIRVI